MRNKKIVFGFMGKAQHGKDSSSEFLINYLHTAYDEYVEHLAFANLLKQQCKEIAFWDGEKDDEGRILLQNFSKPIKRYADYLSKKYPENEFYADMKNGAYYAANTLRDIRESDYDIFTITDFRFKDEVDLFESKDYIKFIPIRVIRTNPDGGLFTGGLSAEALADVSENQLNDYKEMFTIHNNGTLLDLEYKVKKLVDEEIIKILEGN